MKLTRNRPQHFLGFTVIFLSLLFFAAHSGFARDWDNPHVAVRNGHVTFGNVLIGKTKAGTDLLTNHTSSTVTISAIQGLGSGFNITDITLPLVLSPKQSVPLTIEFQPTVPGHVAVTMSFVDPNGNAYLSMTASGTGVTTGKLAPNPSPVAFGSTTVGAHQTSNIVLTNAGGTDLTITSATMSGAGFAMSNLALPLTLPAGTTTSATVTFAPPAAGSFNGNVMFATQADNGSQNVSLPIIGAGVMPGTLTPNAPSIVFGSVQTGSSSTQPETLTNTGGSAVTISQATATGSGFSISGLTLPVTLSGGQSVSFTVVFSPTTSGAASGGISITSNDTTPNFSIPVSGTGAAAPSALASNPASVSFGSIQVGSSVKLSETLTNSGASSITISQANVSGTGFSVSGLTVPLTLTANQSVTFSATFAPTSGGAANGSLSVVSDASNSNLSIAYSGNATAAGQLAVPAVLSFGNVTVGSSASLNGTLTASGAPVNITSASLSNSEFAVSGISLPLTLAAGQSASFAITFTPNSSGATSASLTFASNAVNSPTVQSMTGTGAAPTQHTVDLSWNGSTGAVSYNVYRGSVSGGPYSMINSTTGSTAYTDNTVASGQTYYYVATAVDENSNESSYSNETEAVIPNP